MVLRAKEDHRDEERARVQKNHRALIILVCEIDLSEFNWVSACETT